MSLTLGEKLRQAREERGLSISEVAEQTRISPLYLESIENNDYKILPGGIFNKGFVKSYAKHVGINEQEALQDYTALMSQQGTDITEESKTYRPEVLTDERSRLGLFPTLIFSVIILGLIIWGVMAFLKYYPISTNSPLGGNTNTANSTNTNSAPTPTPTPPPVPSEIKVDFKSISDRINVTYWIDGKMLSKNVEPNETLSLTAPQSIKLSYYRGFAADKIQLAVNGKQITAPTPPAKGNVIIEINKSNISQILQSGSLTVDTPTPANANTAPPRP